MHTLEKTVFILLILSSALACGNASDPGSEEKPESSQQPETQFKKSSFEMHPCDIITEQDIRSMFKVDEESFKVNKSETTFPNCHYTWLGDEMQTRQIGGQQIEYKMECVVSVTTVPQSANASMYEQSLRSYTDELEELNVGDRSVWSNGRHQMTVLSGEHLFHVMVNCTSDNSYNKSKAIALSKKILNSL